MNEKNELAPDGAPTDGDLYAAARAGLRAPTKERLTEDCPIRAIGLFRPCRLAPEETLCPDDLCWRLGADLANACFDAPSAAAISALTTILKRHPREIVDRIIDAYLAQR